LPAMQSVLAPPSVPCALQELLYCL
jgi:hypothetical protein